MQPHFLYNTLETVCGMIQSGESEESIELINQISGFYRAVLNGGQEVVPQGCNISLGSGQAQADSSIDRVN